VAALLLVPLAAGAQGAASAASPRPARATATAVLAGGCFWGVEAVFEHVRGVVDVVSGYSGGNAETAEYEKVNTGVTGHAEAVRITYDPSQVSYGELLRVFFSVAHDPTQKDRQGPDVGPQYRSAIFFADAEQERVARAYVAQLEKARFFKRPIVTEITSLRAFYQAEEYHQDFAARNPRHPYIVHHDLPKVERLKAGLPELYRER
jgi:peptide-methionine (S)-S-oxide reductase